MASLSPTVRIFAFSHPSVNRGLVSVLMNFGSTHAVLEGEASLMHDLGRALMTAATPGMIAAKVAARPAPTPKAIKPSDLDGRIAAYREIEAAKEADPHANMSALCRAHGVSSAAFFSWRHYSDKEPKQ